MRPGQAHRLVHVLGSYGEPAKIHRAEPGGRGRFRPVSSAHFDRQPARRGPSSCSEVGRAFPKERANPAHEASRLQWKNSNSTASGNRLLRFRKIEPRSSNVPGCDRRCSQQRFASPFRRSGREGNLGWRKIKSPRETLAFIAPICKGAGRDAPVSVPPTLAMAPC